MVSLKPSDVVLITAAAGGVGHYAVQYAVSKGCRVLGTCSTKDKEDFLKVNLIVVIFKTYDRLIILLTV